LKNIHTRIHIYIHTYMQEGVLVPEALAGLKQRHVEEWAVYDSKGAFIPPWFGADAVSPGKD
jgi:hypothetical protein